MVLAVDPPALLETNAATEPDFILREAAIAVGAEDIGEHRGRRAYGSSPRSTTRAR